MDIITGRAPPIGLSVFGSRNQAKDHGCFLMKSRTNEKDDSDLNVLTGRWFHPGLRDPSYTADNRLDCRRAGPSTPSLLRRLSQGTDSRGNSPSFRKIKASSSAIAADNNVLCDQPVFVYRVVRFGGGV